MSNPFSLKIVGMDKVLGNIGLFDVRAQENLSQVIKDSAQRIKQAASSNAPKRSGKYKKSFRVKSDKLTAYIGPFMNNRTHPIGHLIEFGTQSHGNHPGTSAQPHLFPAFEQEKPVLAKNVQDAIEKAGNFR